MQHSSILKSIIRVALAQDSPQLRHQVQRLAEALNQDGDLKEAAALSRMLTQSTKATELTPSRVTRSKAGTSLAAHEVLSRSVAVPVDKETSAPLASIVFPGDRHLNLPLFPQALTDNVEALVAEWRQTERVSAAGMLPTLSCLVYGPPGTGKTTLALWLASELGLPAVVARLDGLISSFLGTTARNLGSLFAFANRYNCVLILDEFDAIAKVRDDPNEVGEIKRVVNALLQNMDAREGRGVTIGLTNHEALLDAAIWRRFEVQFAVPLPGFEQRSEIARRYLDVDEEGGQAESKLIAWVGEGLSGAEVRTLVTKYRKRRLLQDDVNVPPVRTVAQLAQSTSVHIDTDRTEVLLGDETTATQELWNAQLGLTHAELGGLFHRNVKTIGRRINGLAEEGEVIGE
jgi:SpoVK/Ycf46/Vps4 family AAA+-type ATPase